MTNNVDLTALLPALKEAVAPFETALTAAGRMRINPDTQIRAFAPLAIIELGSVQRLVDAVQAIRRVTGDLK